MEEFLSENILNATQTIRSESITSQQKVLNLRTYLKITYGPHTDSDFAQIKQELEHATNENGYHQLLAIHDKCLNSIRSIIKQDPVTRIPILDDAGKQINYNISDSELKIYLLKQIDNSDPALLLLKINALTNNSITYETLKSQILHLLKSSQEFNLIGLNDSIEQKSNIHIIKHSLHNNNKYQNVSKKQI